MKKIKKTADILEIIFPRCAKSPDFAQRGEILMFNKQVYFFIKTH